MLPGLALILYHGALATRVGVGLARETLCVVCRTNLEGLAAAGIACK